MNAYQVQIDSNNGTHDIQTFYNFEAYSSDRAIKKALLAAFQIRDIKKITVFGGHPAIDTSKQVF